MEEVGHGHDGEAEHGDSAFLSRRHGPFADSQELVRNSGLARSALIVVGQDHRLADPEPLKAMLEAVEMATAAVGGTPMTGSAVPRTTAADRITRWLLIAIGVYSALLVGFLNLVILNSDKVRDGPSS